MRKWHELAFPSYLGRRIRISDGFYLGRKKRIYSIIYTGVHFPMTDRKGGLPYLFLSQALILY